MVHALMSSWLAAERTRSTTARLLARAQQQPRQQQQQEEEAAAAEADEQCGVRAMPMPVSSVFGCALSMPTFCKIFSKTGVLAQNFRACGAPEKGARLAALADPGPPLPLAPPSGPRWRSISRDDSLRC